MSDTIQATAPVEQSTKERLLDAAIRVFSEKGFLAATVREICQEAGSNVAAVNYHFGDKEKLYNAVLWKVFSEHESARDFNQAQADGLEPEERLAELIRTEVRYLYQETCRKECSGQHFALFLMEMAHPSPFLAQVVDNFIRPNHELALALLRECMGPETPRAVLERCADSIWGQILHHVFVWAHRHAPEPGPAAPLQGPGDSGRTHRHLQFERPQGHQEQPGHAKESVMKLDAVKTTFNRALAWIMSHKLLAGGLVAAMTVAILALGGNKEEAPAAAPAEERSVAVQVAILTPQPIVDVLTLPGETEAVADVTISAERGGPVEWIGPDEGDSVEANGVIAKVDMAALQAELDAAQAAYNLASKQADRRQELLAQGVLSTEEMDKAMNERTAALSTLQQAQVNFAHGQISSPVAGMVNELFVDEGEYVSAGTPVAEIVDLSSIKISINVPEMDVRFLEAGNAATVTVDAYPDQEWTGTVDFVAFKADESTKTFRVKVVVDNSDGRIRPGMLARVSVVRRNLPEALAVPLHTIVDKGGERLVYVVEDGLVRAKQVELGVIAGENIQILSGLVAGDQVITGGQEAVEEGVKVVIR